MPTSLMETSSEPDIKLFEGRRVSLIHGPNFNILELRESVIYGKLSLAEIEAHFVYQADKYGFQVDCFQSNSEGELLDEVHRCIKEGVSAIVINPAAFSHTSIALLDALSCFSGPIVEVHLSNIYQRESFRHHSYVSKAATGVISGFGVHGYRCAVDLVAAVLRERSL